MPKVKVSVILPAYNDERFVARSIQSILDQTFVDFELIVVDDGSTDGTAAIVDALSDPRLRVIHQVNQGLCLALNQMISLSNGEYLARMDDDDISRPDRLARQVDFLDQHPDYGMVGSACEIVAEDGSPLSAPRVPLTDAGIRQAMVWVNPIVHSSVMIRKSVLDQVGWYDIGLSNKGVEDYELWWRVLAQTRVMNLEECLVTRVHRQTSAFRMQKSRHHFAKARIQFRALRSGYALPSILFSLGKSVLAWLGYTLIEFGNKFWRR